MRAETVGIIGAGTMGAGIAQVAAMHAWEVVLTDVDEATVLAAIDGVRARLDRLVEKGRLDPAGRDAAAARLRAAAGGAAFAGCGLVIEAVVEDLAIKTRVLREAIASLPDDAVIATNTSSLSVTDLGAAIGEPRRTVGMHFFNPAPLLALVEIIPGRETDRAVVDRAAAIAAAWGKAVARAADVPGFIVNHVARPYYLEAFRILEDGLAAADEIDAAMVQLGGFRMGPLALTDLIGQDVNAATTRSVWEQLGRPPLLRPCPFQEQLVADGHLGRKTRRGVYRYDEDEPRPALAVDRRPLEMPGRLRDAVDRFTTRATSETAADLPRYVFARILVALLAQATLAHDHGVAERADIDTALRHGTNYPRGPFEWLEMVGADACDELLDALNETTDDRRFELPGVGGLAGGGPGRSPS